MNKSFERFNKPFERFTKLFEWMNKSFERFGLLFERMTKKIKINNINNCSNGLRNRLEGIRSRVIRFILYFPIPHNALRLGGKAEIQDGWLVRTNDGIMGKNDFCCAPNCSNRRNLKENIHFYRIPKEKELRKIWLLRIRRKQFKPTIFTVKIATDLACAQRWYPCNTSEFWRQCYSSPQGPNLPIYANPLWFSVSFAKLRPSGPVFNFLL